MEELEVVGREDDERVEEFACLEDTGVVVVFFVRRVGEEAGEAVCNWRLAVIRCV